MFEINVNEKLACKVTEAEAKQLDVIPLEDSAYHVIYKGKSVTAQRMGLDIEAKEVILQIEGALFRVQIRDHYDQLVEKMGLNARIAQKVNEVKAPMPGLVLEIDVAPGQEVRSGDPLLILEAMKMENVIKSPGDGIVKEVCVQEKQAVDKGELLIIME